MRGERGFTLLETLLALAIGGLLLTAAYAAVVRAAAARDLATERTAGVAAARRALLEIAEAVEGAAPRPFAADANGLQVAHGDPEPSRLTYVLEGDRLVARRTVAFAAARSEPGAPRVLLDGVQAFAVRCFEDGGWTDACAGEAAPRAVELSLRLADGEALRTRVVLPLGGGS